MKQRLLLELSSASLLEFELAVGTIAKYFPSKAVISLSGPMGSGKTEFVKLFCKQKGIKDVSSPTFALHHHYQAGAFSIDHLDLFRIEDEDEIESTGFWDLFSADAGLIFIEWTEKMDLQKIPKNWPLFFVEISSPDSQSRRIQFSVRQD